MPLWLRRICGIVLALALGLTTRDALKTWTRGASLRAAVTSTSAPYGLTSLTLVESLDRAQIIKSEWQTSYRLQQAIHCVELDDFFVGKMQWVGLIAAVLVYLFLPYSRG